MTATITQGPEGKSRLPLPLVRLNHPLRWLMNMTHLIVVRAFGTFAGVLIAVAVYYLITQTTDTMNNAWHTAVPNDHLRHDIRDVGEGVFGALLGVLVGWNTYVKRKPINRFDRFEMERLKLASLKDTHRLKFRQVLLGLLYVLPYAVPGFLVAKGIIAVFDPKQTFAHLSVPTDASLWDQVWIKTQNLFRDNWPKRLMGYASGLFFGRRPIKGVFDDLQLWFVERRVLLDTTGFHRDEPNWLTKRIDAAYQFISRFSPARHIPLALYPPTYQARYNELRTRFLQDATAIPQERHGPGHSLLLAGGAFVAFCLALYGEYIMVFIAP